MFHSAQNSTQVQRILRDCLQALEHFSIRNPQRSRPLPQRRIVKNERGHRFDYRQCSGNDGWIAPFFPTRCLPKRGDVREASQLSMFRQLGLQCQFVPAAARSYGLVVNFCTAGIEMFACRSVTDASQAMIAPPFKSTKQTSSAESAAGPNNSMSVPLPEM